MFILIIISVTEEAQILTPEVKIRQVEGCPGKGGLTGKWNIMDAFLQLMYPEVSVVLLLPR